MPAEPLMQRAVGLAASLDALAALAAHVRVASGDAEVDPVVRGLLADIAGELLGEAAAGEAAPTTAAADTARTSAAVVGMVRAFLRQAVDLVEHPGRLGDWAESDEVLLQGIGRLSGAIAGAFRIAEADLDGLGAGLSAPGARFLDVGTGTGWLAIAMAEAYPALSVVGVDIYEPALRLARANVSTQGLDGRIELRSGDAVDLDEPSTYDAIWLPLPFIPAAAVPLALTASANAVRPGGWLVAGTFGGPDGRLAGLLTDLRIVRSGGRPWEPAEIFALQSAAGLSNAHEVPRTWPAPVRLFAARRAA